LLQQTKEPPTVLRSEDLDKIINYILETDKKRMKICYETPTIVLILFFPRNQSGDKA
jgi:transcriptional regulator